MSSSPVVDRFDHVFLLGNHGETPRDCATLHPRSGSCIYDSHSWISRGAGSSSCDLAEALAGEFLGTADPEFQR